MYTIDLNDLPYYTFQVELDGDTFRFDILWNGRGEFWSMEVYDSDDNILVGGVKCVIGQELLRQYRYLGTPAGGLYLTKVGDGYTEPARDTIYNQNRYLMVYVTEEEWESGTRADANTMG